VSAGRGLDLRWLLVAVLLGLACWALFGQGIAWLLGHA